MILRQQANAVKKMNFNALVDAIHNIHDQFARYTAKAVNLSLTVRNWLIGCYILEYEQRGADRAEYGAGLLDNLAKLLMSKGLSDVSARTLRQCRLFYQVYPQIGQTVSAKSLPMPVGTPIWQTVSAKSRTNALATDIRESTTPELTMDGNKLISHLSFSHFAEMLDIANPLKRTFYEIECIKGNWSVRELKRQIASLYYERCGLSKNKKALSRLTQAKAETDSPNLVIRDPYVFEFLGLKPKEVMSESHLEDALLDKVQDFLLELGRGFCFEARQKRILIGGEYFFVDMVFYHRILRCHVLFELKLDSFKHEHLGQLNSYVGWYKEHEMVEGDNPPVGILLCTAKNHALVKYAFAGMNNRLFVSKYQFNLPSEKELQAFVEGELKKK